MTKMKKLLLLSVVAVCLIALSGLAEAGLIDNSTITIMPSSSPAYPGYDAMYAIDSGPSQFISDYASASQGTGTHLDFNFGKPLTFTSILYTDRTSSGAGNFSNVRGTYDFVTSYQYIFSNNSNFSSPVATITVGPLQTLPNPFSSYTQVQSAANFQGVTAQYVRWQVVSTNGANPGASDFRFTAAPVPAAIWLLGAGLIGLVGIRRKFIA